MNTDIANTVAQYKKHAERARVRAVQKIQPRLFEVANAYDRAADQVLSTFPAGETEDVVSATGFQEAPSLKIGRAHV